ncbi:hypothetical protein VIGAN_11184800, partial [Vigna angularis var. angularis]
LKYMWAKLRCYNSSYYDKEVVEDDDKEVVAQACTSLADIIIDYGFATLEPYLAQLVDATSLLPREHSAWQ